MVVSGANDSAKSTLPNEVASIQRGDLKGMESRQTHY